MMKHYLEITLLPGDELGYYFLLSRVFTQLHLAFVENQNGDQTSPFGITFPQYNFRESNLGRKIRVFAIDKQSLEAATLAKWLERLNDYVHVTSIRDVPSDTTDYASFYRLQEKPTKDAAARRFAKHKQVSFEEALKVKAGYSREPFDGPFIKMESLQSKHKYRIYIRMEKVQPSESVGNFSTYGLGRGTPLPWF